MDVTANDSSRLVERANSLEPDAFKKNFIGQQTVESSLSSSLCGPCPVDMLRSDELSSADFNSCFGLIKETSARAYKHSSRGWKPSEKRDEMSDEEMWYLIVRRPADRVCTGFASFMITVEDGFPVVYLYEIHLSSSLRGAGVGAQLMNLVETIGRNASMKKSMLTVFTSNEGAERFYRRLGYEIDEFSPQPRMLRGGKIKRPDYLILSKALQ